MTLKLECIIEDDRWNAIEELPQLCKKIGDTTTELLGLQPTTASVLFADDAKLQSLNLQFRKLDKPTNVLSFPASNERWKSEYLDYLGDIAISYETVAREAEEQEKSVEAHTAHMIVHGVLHLIGYDHEVDLEAEEMEGVEVDILAELDVANPY